MKEKRKYSVRLKYGFFSVFFLYDNLCTKVIFMDYGP